MDPTTMSNYDIPYDRTPPFTISYTHDREVGKKPVIHHYHNAFELDFFVKADLEIFVRDNKYTIRDGDFFFINEYEIHRIHYQPNRPYARYVINFSKEFIQGMLREARLEPTIEWLIHQGPRKVETKPEQRSALTAIFKAMVSAHGLIDRDPLAGAKVKLNLLQLLIQFKELADQQQPSPAYNPHIRGLIRYIDEHYAKPITLEQLQAEFGLSKYYISHLFKETTYFSLFEYVLSRRILEAKKLLEQTELPIVEVALGCGFNNLQHFYRIFQRHVKQTPLQYRRGVK